MCQMLRPDPFASLLSAAIAGESVFGAALAGYSFGDSINNIKVGNQSVKDHISDFIWNTSQSFRQSCGR